MNIKQYFSLTKNKMKAYDDIAKKCGVKPITVRKWVSGETKPTPENASKLEKATNGIVTIVDALYGLNLKDSTEKVLCQEPQQSTRIGHLAHK